MARSLLLALLVVGAGCRESATQILLAIRFPALELDALRIQAKSATRVLPTVRRPDPPAGALPDPQSVALLLADELAGQRLTISVEGIRLEQPRASGIVEATPARGESVAATVWLSRPTDGGGDSRRDLGADLRRDLPRLDRHVDAPDARRDGASCSAGAFLACKGALLERCNAAGNGVVTVDCAPFACNASAGRCDECAPTAPPVCDGANRVSCSPDGLKVSALCPLGCAQGACCADADGDQVSSCAGDCDDSDPDVHPGQLGFFALPSKGTASFDYNCDKTAELELPSLEACSRVGATCVGHGWQSTLPACGQSETFITCKASGRSMCSHDPAPLTQRCR
ncbi:MAG: hypothetical protein ACOY3Y_00185 [Acidobacteriota bacterium]